LSHIVIIGCGTAGLTASATIRKARRDVEVTVISSEHYPAYSRCGLPFFLSGEVDKIESLLAHPLRYYDMMKIKLLLDTEAVDVDTSSKKVICKGAFNGEVKYDKLILATGSKSFVPLIPGRELEGIYNSRTIGDYTKIKQEAEEDKRALIVGGGLVGVEVASCLREVGVEVYLVEALPSLLPTLLDPDMASIVETRLKDAGITIYTNTKVEEFLGDNRVSSAKIADKKIDVDFVVMATGMRPEVTLAKKIGVELGERGGISVDSKMRTSVRDVYAAGDCVEAYDPLICRPTLHQLATTAIRQAQVAALNAIGEHILYPGSLGSAVTKVLDLEVGVTGLTMSAAEREGFKVLSAVATGSTRPEYIPGGKKVKVKLTVSAWDGRILGGQIVGGEGVAKEINLLSIAIMKGMSVFELSQAETCYAPCVADVWEPLILAAENGVKKLRR